jgi:putative phosphoribosyl transferase
MRFKNRKEAGIELAKVLEKYKGKDVVVYALPRGGVVLGCEIAKHLRAPLDLIIARKIGHPFNREFAVCAVTEDGTLFCDENEKKDLDPGWLKEKIKEEIEEAKRRRETYLIGREPIDAMGKTAIVVDDGIATGLTLKVAIQKLKSKKPRKLIVAVPVSPKDVAEEILRDVDNFIALDIPVLYLGAVGAYYDDFSETTDKDVIRLLKEA